MPKARGVGAGSFRRTRTSVGFHLLLFDPAGAAHVLASFLFSTVASRLSRE